MFYCTLSRCEFSRTDKQKAVAFPVPTTVKYGQSIENEYFRERGSNSVTLRFCAARCFQSQSLSDHVFSAASSIVRHFLAGVYKMVGISPTKTAMEFIAIFFAFALLNTCSCASPGFVLENYSQLAQKFGFPSLPPLPIKFNFSDISKECQDTVANLLQLPVAYSCEYIKSRFVLYAHVCDNVVTRE